MPSPTAELDVHPLAAREIVEAYKYYESRREGAGDKLHRKLRRTSARLIRFPETGSMWMGNLAVRVVEVNPTYRLPYQLRRSSPPPPRVLALAHTSRRPGYWANRIERS